MRRCSGREGSLTVTFTSPISTKLTVAHSASRDSRARIFLFTGLSGSNSCCCSVCLCHAFVLFEVLLQDPSFWRRWVPIAEANHPNRIQLATQRTPGDRDAASTSSRGVPLVIKCGEGRVNSCIRIQPAPRSVPPPREDVGVETGSNGSRCTDQHTQRAAGSGAAPHPRVQHSAPSCFARVRPPPPFFQARQYISAKQHCGSLLEAARLRLHTSTPRFTT